MKKLIFTLSAVFMLCISAAALAADYDFENGGGLNAVTNSLGEGGAAVFGDGFEGAGLKLDGSYGLLLGHVDGDFTAAAMVRVTSGGDNRTLFFKNMGSFENENWTGVIFNGGVPTFWVREGWSKRPTSAKNCMDQWVHAVYTETGGVGRLYIDGEQVAEGSAVSEPGDVYLGSTYWSADALSGSVDNLELLDRALTREEIAEKFKSEVVPVRFARYEFPGELLVSDLDLSLVPGGDEVAWKSSNEAVLSTDGLLTRPAVSTGVTLTGTYRGAAREFAFTAVGGDPGKNKDVILSYGLDVENGLIIDRSGNGNHGAVIGGFDGGILNGGSYIQLPKGLFRGVDEFTIILRVSPLMHTTNQFTLCFGNDREEYFFINTSTPGSNRLRAAITDSGSGGERDLITAPGIMSGQDAAIVITASGTKYKMYLNGILAAEDDLGIKISDFGDTVQSYIGKSVYDDPYFRGVFTELTICSSVMSAEEIYDRYAAKEEPASLSYISSSVYGPEGISLTLERDCMVAANFYDEKGELLASHLRKVSGDDLSADFNVDDEASRDAIVYDIMVFDPASGKLKERHADAFCGGLAGGYTERGGIRVYNSNDRETTAVVKVLTYDGERLSAVDICEIKLMPKSSAKLDLPFTDGSRLFINEK